MQYINKALVVAAILTLYSVVFEGDLCWVLFVIDAGISQESPSGSCVFFIKRVTLRASTAVCLASFTNLLFRSAVFTAMNYKL